MSNLALVAVIIGLVIAWFVFRESGIRRLLLISGLVAIALLIFLIWSGRLSLSEIRASLFGMVSLVICQVPDKHTNPT